MKITTRVVSMLLAVLMISSLAAWAGPVTEAYSLSVTEETTIPATEYYSLGGTEEDGYLEDADAGTVTVPASGTIQFKVKAPEVGTYRIWLQATANNGAVTMAAPATVTEIAGSPVTFAQYATSVEARKTWHANATEQIVDMGRYNFATTDEVTLTFTLSAENSVKNVIFKKVDNIAIAAEGATTVAIQDYLYHSDTWTNAQIYTRGGAGADQLSEASGFIRGSDSYNGGAYQVYDGIYTAHSINVPTAGIYSIKAYGALRAANKTTDSAVILKTGKTFAEAKAVAASEGNTDTFKQETASTEAMPITYEFDNVLLSAGENHVILQLIGNEMNFEGFTVEKVGDLLSVSGVKYNDAALEEDAQIDSAAGATFAVNFNKAVNTDTVSNETIYLAKGGEKVDATIGFADDNKTVTLTLGQGVALDYAANYSIYVEGVEDVADGTTVTGYALNFATNRFSGVHSLSATAETTIAATDYEAIGGAYTEANDAVTVPANGTISYKVQAAETGIYKIDVQAAATPAANVTISVTGATRVGANAAMFASGIYNLAEKQVIEPGYAENNSTNTGRYNLTADEEVTLTFTATAEVQLKNIYIKKVSGIDVAATGATAIGMQDYVYYFHSYWNAVERSARSTAHVTEDLPGVVGYMKSETSVTGRAIHTIDVAEKGIYKITVIGAHQANFAVDTSFVTLQTGKTLADARNVEIVEGTNKKTYSESTTNSAHRPIVHEFENIVLDSGENYILTTYSGGGGRARIVGFKIEKTGSLLDVSSVKYGDTALTEGLELDPAEVRSFSVDFNLAINSANIADQIYLKKGDETVATNIAIAEGNKTVTLTLADGVTLDYGSNYTLYVEGVTDGTTTVTGVTRNFTTKAFSVSDVKYNTTTLEENAELAPTEAESFTVVFNAPIDASSVNANTIYLAKGTTKVSTGISVSGNTVTLSLNGAALSGSSSYQVCVEGVATAGSSSTITGFVRNFTTSAFEGVHSLSATAENVIAATDNSATTGTAADGAVTVPASGTISFKVNAAVTGTYRIWLQSATTGNISTVGISGSPAIAEISGTTLASGITDEAAPKQTNNGSPRVADMGHYTLTEGVEQTLTFTPSAELALQYVILKKVDNIAVAEEGITAIPSQDYLYHKSSHWSSFGNWLRSTSYTSDAIPYAGHISSETTKQYVAYSINVPVNGIYNIKLHTVRQGVWVIEDSYMTLATGKTMAEARAVEIVDGVNKKSYSIAQGAGTNNEQVTHDFGNIALKSGENFLLSTFYGGRMKFTGITIEKVGDMLDVSSVKYGDTALTNDLELDPAEVTSFSVDFNLAINSANITDQIYLKKGDTVVTTNIAIAEGNKTVTLTLPEGVKLDYGSNYTLYVEGVTDGTTTVTGVTRNFTTKALSVSDVKYNDTALTEGAELAPTVAQSFTVMFNAPIDTATATANTIYLMKGATKVSTGISVAADNKSVTLSLNGAALSGNSSYKLCVEGIATVGGSSTVTGFVRNFTTSAFSGAHELSATQETTIAATDYLELGGEYTEADGAVTIPAEGTISFKVKAAETGIYKIDVQAAATPAASVNISVSGATRVGANAALLASGVYNRAEQQVIEPGYAENNSTTTGRYNLTAGEEVTLTFTATAEVQLKNIYFKKVSGIDVSAEDVTAIGMQDYAYYYHGYWNAVERMARSTAYVSDEFPGVVGYMKSEAGVAGYTAHSIDVAEKGVYTITVHGIHQAGFAVDTSSVALQTGKTLADARAVSIVDGTNKKTYSEATTNSANRPITHEFTGIELDSGENFIITTFTGGGGRARLVAITIEKTGDLLDVSSVKYNDTALEENVQINPDVVTSFAVDFGMAVDTATVDANTIYLAKDDGTKVSTEISFANDNKTVTLTLGTGVTLDYGANYKICVEGVEAANGGSAVTGFVRNFTTSVTVKVSDVKYNDTTLTEGTGINPADVTTFSVYFNVPVNTATATADTIYLAKGDVKVATEISFADDNKTVTLTLGEGVALDYDANYTLCVEGVAHSSGASLTGFVRNFTTLEALTVSSVKYNDADLTEGLAIAPVGTESFTVNFSIPVNTDTVTANTIYLAKGDTKVATSISVAADNKSVTLSLNGAALSGNTSYKICVAGVAAADGLTTVSDFARNFTTQAFTGAHSLSTTDETTIAAIDNSATTGTAADGVVTVPASGTISFKVQAAVTGTYRIWAESATKQPTATLAISGSPAISEKSGSTIVSGVADEAAHKAVTDSNATAVNMGHYTLTAGVEQTLTFTPTAEFAFANIYIRRVDNIPVAESGVTAIASQDYLYHKSSYWTSFDNWCKSTAYTSDAIPYAGHISSESAVQYAVYSINVPVNGIYNIKLHEVRQGTWAVDNSYMTLRTGKTLAEAAAVTIEDNVNKLYYSAAQSAGVSNEQVAHNFGNIALSAGENFLYTTFQVGRMKFTGITIEKVGDALSVLDVKYNDATLAEGSALDPAEVTSFSVDFNKAVARSSVNANTIYLEKDGVKVATTIDYANEDKTVTLTLGQGVTLDYASNYKVCVEGVEDADGSTVTGFVRNFTTPRYDGAYTLSATEETTIAAIDYTAKSEDATEADGAVTVPANGTISFKVKAAETGIYKIDVQAAATPAAYTIISVTGATRVGANAALLASGVYNRAEQQVIEPGYAENNSTSTGRYNLTAGEEVTLTFTATAEVQLKNIYIKKVSGIDVSAEDVTAIGMQDYAYYYHGYWNAVERMARSTAYVSDEFPGVVGYMKSETGVSGYTAHSIDVAERGVYKITVHGIHQAGFAVDNSSVAIQTGKTLADARGVAIVDGTNKKTYSSTDTSGTNKAITHEFTGIELDSGENFILTTFAGGGGRARLVAITIEKTGSLLDVSSVKYNDQALTEGLELDPAEVTSFSVEFNKAIDTATVDANKIYLANGDTKVSTEISFADDNKTVTLTLGQDVALNYGASYKLCVEGVKDADGSAVTGFVRNFTTKALSVSDVKYNDTSLAEGAELAPVGTESFTVVFNAPIDAATVTANTVYLAKGETKVATTSTVSADNKSVTLSLDGTALSGNSNYKVCVEGVATADGASTVTGFVRNFTTEAFSGAHALSTTVENVIAATDYFELGGEYPEADGTVTVPAEGTISFKVKPAEAGTYRIWVQATANNGVVTMTAPATVTEIAGSAVSFAQYAENTAGRKTWHASAAEKIVDLGRYNFTTADEVTLTFTLSAENTVANVIFKKVDNIAITDTGVTTVAMQDYLYHSGQWTNVQIYTRGGAGADQLSEVSGFIRGAGTYNAGAYNAYSGIHTSHSINVPTAGVYEIKVYGALRMAGKTTDSAVILRTGTTFAEAKAVAASEGNTDTFKQAEASTAAMPIRYEFDNVVLSAGENYVNLHMLGEEMNFEGFTVERKGDALSVSDIKYNDTTLTEGLELDPEVVTSFTVEFNKAIDTATATANEIYLAKEDGTKVSTSIGFANDNKTVTLTLGTGVTLDYGTNYKVCVDGVEDSTNSSFARVTRNFTTKALSVSGVKYDDADLTEGLAIAPVGTESFTVNFNAPVDRATVTTNTVYLAKGDTKVATSIDVSDDNKSVTLTLDGTALSGNSNYKVCVEGVATADGASTVTGYVRNFTTTEFTGAHMLSATVENMIAATDNSATTGTEADGAVTVPASGTISFKVKAAETGIYKIDVEAAATPAANVTISVTGATRVGANAALLASGVYNRVERQTIEPGYAENNSTNTGRYNLTAGEEVTLTFTATAEVQLKNIYIKKVSGIDVAAEGATAIGMQDYAYYYHGYWNAVERTARSKAYVSDEFPGVVGYMKSETGATGYTAHSIDVAERGVYKITVHGIHQANFAVDNSYVALQTGKTLAEARAVELVDNTNKKTYSESTTNSANRPIVHEFENIVLDSGENFIITTFSGGGGRARMVAITVERMGDALDVSSIKYNTTEFAEGATIPSVGTTSFTVNFSKAFDPATVDSNTIYLMKDTTKVATSIDVADDNKSITLTLNDVVLSGLSNYKICVNGIEDSEYGAAMTNFVRNFSTERYEGTVPLSSTTESEISAANYTAITNGVADLEAGVVTVQANGSISVQISPKESGTYRIWTQSEPYAGVTMALTATTEERTISERPTATLDNGVTSNLARKSAHASNGSIMDMGRYDFNAGEEITLTFTPSGEYPFKNIIIKKVDELDISAATGVITMISAQDYLYYSGQWTAAEIYCRSTASATAMAGSTGILMSSATQEQYAAYSINAPEAGIYNIKGHATLVPYVTGDDYASTEGFMTLRAGKTLYDARSIEVDATNKNTYTYQHPSDDRVTEQIEYNFGNIQLYKGENVLLTSYMGDRIRISGLTVECVGDVLNATSVAYNGTELAEDAVINSEGVTRFTIDYEGAIDRNTVDPEKVYVAKHVGQSLVRLDASITYENDNSRIVVTLNDGIALEGSSYYRFCVDGIKDTAGGPAESVVRTFATERFTGAYSLSATQETTLSAMSYFGKTASATVDVTAGTVVVPVGNTVSFKVNAETSGTYRIWVQGETYVEGATIAISGVTEKAQVAFADSITSNVARKETHNAALDNLVDMGRYEFTAGQDKVITFTPSLEYKFKNIIFKKVDNLGVELLNATRISVQDYMYYSGNWETVETYCYYPAFGVMAGSEGAVLGAADENGDAQTQYMAHSISIPSAGAYNIKVHGFIYKQTTDSVVTLQTGRTFDEAKAAQAITKTYVETTEPSGMVYVEYDFGDIALSEDTNYLITSFSGLNLMLSGFTIERSAEIPEDISVHVYDALDEETAAVTAGKMRATATFKEEPSKNVFFAFAIYKANNLTSLPQLDRVATETGMKTSFEVSIEDITFEEGYTYSYKVFVWEDDSLAPLRNNKENTEASAYRQIYVATTGNDTTGDGSYASPFATIARAKDEVAAISEGMTGDIIVNIGPGEYKLEETEVFGPEHSGKNGFNVIFRGSDKNNPSVISGGQKVTGWSDTDGDGIWSAPLTGVDEVRNLYVNEIPASRARTKYTYRVDSHLDANGEHDGFLVKKRNFPTTITRPEDLEIGFTVNWENTRIPIDGLQDADTHYLFTSSADTWDNWPKATNNLRAYFENAMEFLDEPGEFYYNKGTNTIYYYPYAEENMTSAVTYVGDTEQLIKIYGTSNAVRTQNLVFDNFKFVYGAWNFASKYGYIGTQSDASGLSGTFANQFAGQIELKNADHITIKNCEIACLGSAAINMSDSVSNTNIEGNIIRDVSGTGIKVGETNHNIPPAGVEQCTNISINNNIVTRTGGEFYNNCGVSVIYATNVDITHNIIKDIPYSGISLGWGWNSEVPWEGGGHDVSYNLIENTMIMTRDGGGIYTLGRQHGTRIHNNHIKNHDSLYDGALIYHDAGTQYIEDFHNVLEDAGWYVCNPLQGYGAKEIYFHDNFAINSSERYDAGEYPAEDRVRISDATLLDSAEDDLTALGIVENAGLTATYAALETKENVTFPTYRAERYSYYPDDVFKGSDTTWGIMLEAEDFDGDEYGASGNKPNNYRPEIRGFQFYNLPEMDSPVMANFLPRQWTKYTFTVTQAGTYNIDYRAMSYCTYMSDVEIYIDNVLVASPWFGGDKVYKTVTTEDAVTLTAGTHVLKLVSKYTHHVDYVRLYTDAMKTAADNAATLTGNEAHFDDAKLSTQTAAMVRMAAIKTKRENN